MRCRALGLIGLLSCAVMFTPLAQAGRYFPEQPGEDVAPLEFIVKLKGGASPDSVLSTYVDVKARKKLAQGNAYLVHLRAQVPPGQLKKLAEDPQIDYVEPNRIRRNTMAVPSDPRYSLQWALTKTRAKEAWALLPGRYLTAATAGTGRVKVAVLDTGADCTHPDFKNTGGTSVYSSAGGQLSETLSDAYVTSTYGTACYWQDDHGHGTHVAGTIAAATSNGEGVGALGYPLELIVYKVLDRTGSGFDSDIANAIVAATNAGARVISLSLGGAGYSQWLQDAVTYAWNHDVLLVAAAGNSNLGTLHFPSGAHHAFGVAATDSAGAKAYFSNFGVGVDIAAPGVGILSTYPTHLGSYASMSGTSMATPHVSALSGLVAISTPGLAAGGISRRLQRSAQLSSADWNQYLGWGNIDAYQALTDFVRTSTTGSITGQVVDSSELPAGTFTISVAGQNVPTDANGLFRVPALAPGLYAITATGAAGTVAGRVVVLPGADAPITLRLGVPAGTISGVVSNGGGALAEATVQALQNGLVVQESTTDAYGNYVLTVPAGAVEIRVTALSHGLFRSGPTTVAAGAQVSLNAFLPKFGTIAGTVSDTSGAPISGSDVVVSGGASVGATPDATGHYATIGVPPGGYTVTANAPAYNSADQTVVVSGEAVSPANFTLGNTIEVSVSPSSGPPLAQYQTRQFTATVTGATNQAVTWTRSPAVGTLSTSGLYTAPGWISTPQAVTITATSVQNRSRSASVTITVANVFTISASTSLAGGASSSANKILLEDPAPAGGGVVALSSDHPALSVPATVTVPAGTKISPTFTMTTSNVPATTTVRLSATYNGVTKILNVSLRPVGLYAVSLTPTIVGGGMSSSVRVTLDGPAPASGVVVNLSSSNPAVVAPASVTVPAGATYANTNATTTIVPERTTSTITATYNGVNRTAALTIDPIAVQTFTTASVLASGGKYTSARVTLNAAAPAGGAVVTLSSSNPSVLSVPATVTVPQGATASPYFTVQAAPVAAQQVVAVTAAYSGTAKSASITVRKPALTSISLYPASIASGTSSTGNRITLDGVAAAGGVTVQLANSNPGAVNVPASIVVPAGATFASFTATAQHVAASASSSVTAALDGVSKTASVTVLPTAVSSVVLPASVFGGTSYASNRVTLNGPAPAGGAVVSLQSSNPAVLTAPATVTVAAGATNAYFTTSSSAVAVSTPVTISATFGGVTKSASTSVNPAALYSFSLYPLTVKGGGSTTQNRVTLYGIAAAGGVAVSLTSSNPSVVAAPANVLVAAGTNTAYFTIQTSAVTAPTPVTVTATVGSVTKAATLTVNP